MDNYNKYMSPKIYPPIKKCIKCDREFESYSDKYLASRKMCLDCSPKRRDNLIHKKCKECGQDFRKTHRSTRENCYGCQPEGKNHLTTTHCSDCGIKLNKENGKFRKNRNKFDPQCRSCNSERERARKRERKQQYVDYKGGKCCRCGYDKSLVALDLHHRNPEEKEFEFFQGPILGSKVKAELDKCDLVCSNCHREIHAEIMDKKRERYLKVLNDHRSKYDPEDFEKYTGVSSDSHLFTFRTSGDPFSAQEKTSTDKG